MTTYSFDVFYIEDSYNSVTDTHTTIAASQDRIDLVTDASTPTVSYTVNDFFTDTDTGFTYGEVGINDEIGELLYARHSTGSFSPVEMDYLDVEVFTVSWGASNTSTIMSINYGWQEADPNITFMGEFIFVLAGDDLSTITDAASFEAFLGTITSIDFAPHTGVQAGDDIAISSFGNGTSKEADDFEGTAGDDTVNLGAGIDRYSGNEGNDTINGDDGQDILYGDDGDDIINGGAVRDKLYGGADHDTISGGGGSDAIFGGSGNDTLSGGKNGDTIKGGIGHDIISGDDGNDKLYGSNGQDTINGGRQNDLVDGGSHDDILHGDDGNDKLKGRQGADELFGDAGDDTLQGGSNQDTLYGGLGDDSLHGGTHADVFVFSSTVDEGTDTILDFEIGVDTVEVNDYDGASGAWSVTSSGDSGADFVIELSTGTTIVIENGAGNDASDFILAL